MKPAEIQSLSVIREEIVHEMFTATFYICFLHIIVAYLLLFMDRFSSSIKHPLPNLLKDASDQTILKFFILMRSRRTWLTKLEFNEKKFASWYIAISSFMLKSYKGHKGTMHKRTSEHNAIQLRVNK